MDTQRWELAGSIFERLLGTPEQEREVLLETLCGADAELKGVVLSMLDSESSALRFDRALAANELPTATLDVSDSPDNLPGGRVGPWLLVRKLGTGGMGVVWLGERVDGQFEQRAALKLIKRGMDSEAVLKRFLRERQILARLVHPHIAHLLDGGIAADGRPYFAMEYVEGLPLLRYCHERGISLEERIRLFLRVCDAVQFAHANHVVHRDLKPSNILITAGGDVKLLDFGIAKLLEGDTGPDETITQLHRERPMTPMYAAPEQIRGERISGATDVYALGCVLYELLTGQHARDVSKAVNIKEVLQIVETTDPVAPSRLKLASMPVARKRLRGDLDTIVLTALRRDPARRYASAAAFAADLKNFLDGKPIAARGDGVFYRGYKYLRRHRVVLAAGLAIVAVATAATFLEVREREPASAVTPGSAIAIVDFNNLSQNRDDAWLAPALAEMLAAQLALGGNLHALPDELVRPARADLAAPLTGGYARQSLATLRKRLGADYVLSGSYLVSGSGSDARLRLDLALQDARSGAGIANVVQTGAFADLSGLIDNAGRNLRDSLGLATASPVQARQIDKAQPPNLEVARRFGNALDALRRNDPAHARDELIEAVALSPGYAAAYLRLAQAWKMLGYDAKALAMAQQAAANSENLPPEQRTQIAREVAAQKGDWADVLKFDRELLAADPGNPELHLALIRDLPLAGHADEVDAAFGALRKLPGIDNDPRVELAAAALAGDRGDAAAQEQHAQRALQLAQSRDAIALAAEAKLQLGMARDAAGKRDEAMTLIRDAAADYQRIGNPHGEAEARKVLANVLVEQNQVQAGGETYQQALAIYQRIGDQHGVADIYSNLARMLWAQGDRDAAAKAVQNALDIQRETGDLSGQGWSLTALAVLASDEAASDNAVDMFRQALAIDERSGAKAHHLFVLTRYADVLRQRGQLAEAQDVCDQARNETGSVTDPASTLGVESTCAYIAMDRGQLDAAAVHLNAARAIATKLTDVTALANIDLNFALIEMASERWTQALERLDAAIGNYASGETIAGEASAQSLAALCHQALQRKPERDKAAARASELRSRITARQEVLVVDIALSQLRGEMGERELAITALRRLAQDAEMRQWLGQAMEARLAELRVTELGSDATRIATLRAQIESAARQHGFAWVLARLRAAPAAGQSQPTAAGH